MNTSSVWQFYGSESDNLIASPNQFFSDLWSNEPANYKEFPSLLQSFSNSTADENEMVAETEETSPKPEFTKVLFFESLNRPKWVNTQQFIVTPQGYFESSLQKFQSMLEPKEYIPATSFTIDSRPSTDKNIIPILDMTVSPMQASIRYEDCLRPYFTFMLSQRRKQQLTKGTDSLLCRLPKELHILIFSFIGERNSYFLRDEGSQEGTYLTVPSTHPKTLRSDKIYKLSSDTSIRILEVGDGRNYKKLSQDAKVREDQSYMLRKFAKYDDVRVVGLNSCNTHKLYAHLEPFNKDRYEASRNLRWEDHLRFSAPFMKLELIEEKGAKVTRFLAICSQKTSFLIGRNETADVPTTSRTCSRKHCTIFYDMKIKNWKIVDGSAGEASLGGTWESLQSIKQIKEKTRSVEVPITEGSRFKFGDAVFDFTYKKVKK